MRDALCLEYPAEWFAPQHRAVTVKAKAVCMRCVVRDACLDYCLSDPNTRAYGVWGGTTPDERKHLRTGRDRAA
jgi:WhiB family redox-sensing transcriptional regulator